jgi:hypothetical protein
MQVINLRLATAAGDRESSVRMFLPDALYCCVLWKSGSIVSRYRPFASSPNCLPASQYSMEHAHHRQSFFVDEVGFDGWSLFASNGCRYC